VLTQERVHARLLGHKKDITIPTSAALFATGNNLRVKGDATRRVLLCTIDCGEEFPEQREFEIDLIADVERRRPELVSAVLTIARWHHQNRTEMRKKGLPFASYEYWTSRVRDPLIALGHADPVAALALARGTDPEAEALAALAATWTATIGDRELTCREVVAHVTDTSGGLANSDFADALLAVAEQGKGISTKRLGRFLVRYENRNIGGYSFVRVGKGADHNVVRWALKAVK
jgi:putative DNA primase/helicase